MTNTPLIIGLLFLTGFVIGQIGMMTFLVSKSGDRFLNWIEKLINKMI